VQEFLFQEKTISPFSISAKVKCRKYSIFLERKIVDFAADIPFAKIPKKMKEHYNIEVPTSSCQKITKKHAKNTSEKPIIKVSNKKEACIIAETDGVMVPTVEVNNESKDKRKTRKSQWKEVKLNLAKKAGSIDKFYGATIISKEKSGDLLEMCVKKIGLGEKTHIHFLSDGALWIEEQVELKFGTQAKHLIDFYHLSEYLSAASEVCSSDKKEWLKIQQKKAKENKIREIIEELEKNLENDNDNKVKKCLRYIKNRIEKFDYKTAIEKKLPIGSGEIESANRSIVQRRLKIPGAWWKKETVESMLALICMIENGNWEEYWKREYEKIKAA
jgi:hypothetical protein